MANKIKFHATQEIVDAFPHPYPSGKVMPDWFKSLPAALSDHPRSSSVKRCLPFIDAMSQGYIIPFHCDVWVVAENNNLRFEFAEKELTKGMSDHSYDQVMGHPMKDEPFGNVPLKWHNPWVIETPKNYSCLFTSPLNRMEKRFKVLDGVVDTDTYYNHVHFPLIWTGGEGKFLITRGTPLIQVIPFKRETLGLEVSVLNKKKQNKVQNSLITYFSNGYRKLFWHKMEHRR